MIVWPPPSVPIFSSMSADGSLPSLVRNGPLAVIRRGLSSPGLPFSWIVASSFRFALWIELLNALSSRFWTSSWSFPPPQEASASAAKSRRNTARRTRPQSSWRPPQLGATGGRCSERMGYVKRIVHSRPSSLTAVAAAPAHAGTVIEVDGKTRPSGERSRRCPTRAEIALAAAGPARRRRGGRRWPAHRRSRGRRAVYARPPQRSCARKHIKKSQYRRWRATYVRSVAHLRRLRGARAAQLGYVLDVASSRWRCAGG